MRSTVYLKVKEFVIEHGLISCGDKIVAGVSGGADSVFLFMVLAGLAREYSLSLCAVHVNHGIRGEEAVRDEEFTKNFVQGLGYRCEVFCKDIPGLARDLKITEEEAGRRYRYECFESIRNSLGFDKIAVAHHKDDQAETVLFQLFRGSGIKGLGGMKPENGNIIRPLLGIRRCEIENALLMENVGYCIDCTNSVNKYSRNIIRNVIIPYIEENIQPAITERLSGTAGQLRDIYTYIDTEAEKLYKEIVKEDNGICMVDVGIIGKEDIVLQREIFLRMAGYVAGQCKDITSKHIGMVASLVCKDTGKKACLPYGMVAYRNYDKICIMKEGQDVQVQPGNNNIIDICVPGKTELEYINGEKHIILFERMDRNDISHIIEKNYCTKCFDYDKIKFMPQFRYPENGDYIWLRMDGSKKKLSRVFIDSKIPASERARIWVLAEGSHILWIPSMGRCSAYYYVTGRTREVLRATLCTEGEN
ncbi:MAG: tRNA lysidine(34) synthetase TilS [Lachnospiraceae bacterium]|nr:tRNA lysidine(34) synthetase TilS [Lachnospiraceae bacterium]